MRMDNTAITLAQLARLGELNLKIKISDKYTFTMELDGIEMDLSHLNIEEGIAQSYFHMCKLIAEQQVRGEANGRKEEAH